MRKQLNNLSTPGGWRAWPLRLIGIFVAVLGAAGIVSWQHDNAQENVNIFSQSQENRSAPIAIPEPSSAKIDSQFDAPFQSTQGKSPTPGQPDPFRIVFEESTKIQPTLTTEQMDAEKSPPVHLQNLFAQALEESKHKEPATLISPFGPGK